MTTNPATWTTTESDLRALCLMARGTCGEHAARALAQTAARLSAVAFRKLTPECQAMVAETLEVVS